MQQSSEQTVYSRVRRVSPPSGWSTWLKRIVGVYPRLGPVPVERSKIEQPIIQGGPLPVDSFMPFAPFQRFDPEHQQMVTPDGRRAVFLNLVPADIEGREQAIIEEIANKVSIAFENIPSSNPAWIIQIYINDEPIKALIHNVSQYAQSKTEGFPFQREWLRVLDEHFRLASRRNGVFKDQKSGLNWRAKYRRVRLVIYKQSREVSPEALNGQALRLVEGLNEAGIKSSRMHGKGVYEWLMPWYSGERDNAYNFLDQFEYPEEAEENGELGPGFDLAEMCFRGNQVTADAANQCWHFGQRVNRFITLQPYRGIPRAGLWNIESTGGGAPFDRMPDGAILSTTLVIEPQDAVEGRLQSIINASIGDSQDAMLTSTECTEALQWMAKDNRLITWLSGLYIDAETIPALNDLTSKTIAAANAANFEVINPEYDLQTLDTFARCLPMAFRPELDRRVQKRARLSWDSHASRLLPLFCRGRGTPHPGMLFFSRDGEPVQFDPLGADREKNAHLLMLGPTGSGKTATLVSLLLQTMAVHKPRLFLITALPTFYLLADYYESQGLSVNKVQINLSTPPSLPPFSDITKLITNEEAGLLANERDILGEAEISARLMITGGDPDEERRLRKEDKALIKQAILLAAKTVVDAGRDQALTEDIVIAMRELAQDQNNYNQSQRDSLSNRAAIIEMYTTGFEGQVFNLSGEPWEDADVTIVELGLFARKGYEDKLAIAMAGLMAKINNVVEDNQFSGRHTITVIDEGHILVKNPLIGPYLNSITAMWRTFGGWLWLATQNLSQFPESARELLNQPEFWICLNTDEDEVAQITRFKELSDEQQGLLKSTRKEVGKYTEGVVMSKKLMTLFRNVPPALALALAQTEPDEKAHRRHIMNELGIDELAAARHIATEINQKRQRHGG